MSVISFHCYELNKYFNKILIKPLFNHERTSLRLKMSLQECPGQDSWPSYTNTHIKKTINKTINKSTALEAYANH